MAKIFHTLIAVNNTPLIEANVGASNSKYIRACRKIIKKISRNELKRPDGMATLLSGSYAYNYIHGCEPDDDNVILQHLVFLCVTEALSYAATPSETREVAYTFLNCIRRKFIQQFNGDLNVLFKATSTNLSDTASIDSSHIFQIDTKMKSDLRYFSASIKDEMLNIDKKDIDDDDVYNDEDEKKSMHHASYGSNNDASYGSNNDLNNNDLRSNPPPSGSGVYETASGSRLDQIIDNIEMVKKNAIYAVEQAMTRNEKLPLLQSKADGLADESVVFRNRSRRLNWRYCRDLYKQRCIIICVIVFVLYLLSAMICGWKWQSCG